MISYGDHTVIQKWWRSHFFWAMFFLHVGIIFIGFHTLLQKETKKSKFAPIDRKNVQFQTSCNESVVNKKHGFACELSIGTSEMMLFLQNGWCWLGISKFRNNHSIICFFITILVAWMVCFFPHKLQAGPRPSHSNLCIWIHIGRGRIKLASLWLWPCVIASGSGISFGSLSRWAMFRSIFSFSLGRRHGSQIRLSLRAIHWCKCICSK